VKLFQRAQNSLFGEILDSLVVPALIVVALSIGITWLVARGIANAPYDRALSSAVRLLARDVAAAADDRGSLARTAALIDDLRRSQADQAWYRVQDAQGRLLAGDAALPPPHLAQPPTPGVVYLRDAEFHGHSVRVADLWVAPGEPASASDQRMALEVSGTDIGATEPDALAEPASPPGASEPPHAGLLLVQLAETRARQARLARDIVSGVLLPLFALVPLAILLLWVALARGIKPLSVVEDRIRERRPDDLSPIDASTVPLEVTSMVLALNLLLGKLADSIRTQKRFLADAAHQLKTPLAGLRMQADLAQREGSNTDELKRSLQQIGRASMRATHTVNQLLALARAEAGAGLPAHQRCDLAQLTIDVVHEVLPRAMERALDLGFEGADPGTRGVSLLGNATLLRELIRNLLDNAINYTPSRPGHPGVITARVRAGLAGEVLLEVEDNGPGIAETERELVFEPFYRVLGNDADGSGLGLPIVMEIARQHAATVTVEDARPGREPPGTRFRVRFPAHDRAAAAAAPALSEAGTG
jgi:two-component system sensor histidine kinase TctE